MALFEKLMVNSKSVRVRFMISLASNGMRALLSFSTGLVLARAMTPAGYGDLSFLLGSFVALRTLLDLGTSNAFYTFISQEKRPAAYYSYYFLWLSAQFFFTAAVIFALLPGDFIDRIWLGHSRQAVLLAFAASFLQQQIWQTVNQVGEASRETLKVQALNVSLALVYLAGASALSYAGLISVNAVLCLLIAQYAFFSVLAVLLLRRREKAGAAVPSPSLTEMFAKYGRYCSPLILLSVIGFFHDFADKWLLQFFGGAGQQGFYQVAFQFSTVSILATTSMLNILWKEISEAYGRGDSERIERLFARVARGLYMTGAAISGFLVPWSRELLELFLGKAYVPAGMVFSLMLLYPVHQSLGQVAGTMMLAGERTKQYLRVSAFFMFLSLPLSYLLQARSEGLFPGLGLGALGLALKMVVLNVASVNVMLWVVARNNGWRFKWAYQAAGLGLALGAGYTAKAIILPLFAGYAPDGAASLGFPMAVSGVIYCGLISGALWLFPGLAGLNKAELLENVSRLRVFVKKSR